MANKPSGGAINSRAMTANAPAMDQKWLMAAAYFNCPPRPSFYREGISVKAGGLPAQEEVPDDTEAHPAVDDHLGRDFPGLVARSSKKRRD